MARREAYSKAAVGSWIEQGPMTTNSRSDSPLRILDCPSSAGNEGFRRCPLNGEEADQVAGGGRGTTLAIRSLSISEVRSDGIWSSRSSVESVSISRSFSSQVSWAVLVDFRCRRAASTVASASSSVQRSEPPPHFRPVASRRLLNRCNVRVDGTGVKSFNRKPQGKQYYSLQTHPAACG